MPSSKSSVGKQKGERAIRTDATVWALRISTGDEHEGCHSCQKEFASHLGAKEKPEW